MGPPRRNAGQKPQNAKKVSNPVVESPAPQPALTQTPPSLGMTTEARYQHNLKVLRRRDPTILSIFDQYDHICVYRQDGRKWEKHGYEGSMFLFESYVTRYSICPAANNE